MRRSEHNGVSIDGDPDNLPNRSAGEVFIALAVTSSGGSQKSYHTQTSCQYLLNLDDVRPAPKDSLTDDWDVCSQCIRERLPDRGPDEVWTAMNPSARGATSYHVDAGCSRLQGLDSVRTVGREAMRGSLDLDKCPYCGSDYYNERTKTGTQLSTVLKREDVNPDNYQEAIREWQAAKERDTDPDQEECKAETETETETEGESDEL